MAGRKPGTPKTGGRKKGSLNKRTREMLEKANNAGLTPLEYMMRILQDETADPALRFEAAKAAAPYKHPRLTAVEHSGNAGKPLTIQVVTGVPREERDVPLANGHSATH